MTAFERRLKQAEENAARQDAAAAKARGTVSTGFAKASMEKTGRATNAAGITTLPVFQGASVQAEQNRNTALHRSGQRRDHFDAGVRERFSQRHPEYTGGESGEINRGLNSGRVRLSAGQGELERLAQAYDADPTQENAAAWRSRYDQFTTDLNAYNRAVEQYKKYNSSEGLKSRMEPLRQKRDEARRAFSALSSIEQGNAGAEAAFVGSAYGSAGQALEALRRYEGEYNRLLNQYYVTENQEQQAALQRDSGMTGQYAEAKELQEDMEKTLALMAYVSQGYGDPAKAEEYREYLGQKYGLDQQAVDQYRAAGASGAYIPRTDGGYNNISELYDELERRKNEAASALSAGGYDYERMTGYEQMLQDAEEYQAKRKQWTSYAEEHPALSSIGTVLLSPFQGVEYLKTMAGGVGHSDVDQPERYVPMNVYNMDVTNFVSQTRGAVAEKIEENTDWELFGRNVAAFVYESGMSVADSTMNLAAFGPGGALLVGSGSAAANQARDVIERGGTNAQAFWSGLAAGAAEALFEKVSIDSLLAQKSVNGWRSWLKETLKQSGVEASEEMLTEVSNILSDTAIMGENGGYAKAAAVYARQPGVTEDEAKRMAFLDCIGQVVQAGAGGAFSGGLMGGTVNAVNGASNAQSGRQRADFQGLPMFEQSPFEGLPSFRRRSVETLPSFRQAQASVDTRGQNAVSDGAVEATGQNKTASTGETGYNRMEADAIRHEGKTFRNLVAGIDSSVSAFFEKWRGGRKNQQGEKLEKLYLGRMSESVKQQVSAILGYSIDGRDFIVTNDDVKHIMDEHGDPDTEVRKGNLPLDTWALDSLQDIVANPDSITPGHMGEGKKNAGKMGVVFTKTFPNGRVVCIQFDNKGRGTMEAATMYVKKGNTTSEMNADKAAPIRTSETPEPVFPNTPIIAQDSTGGNTQSAQGEGERFTGGFGANTVGAAENPFKSAPKISRVESNTFEKGGIYNEVDKQMAGVRAQDLSYDPISERQSMSHALERLMSDFEGEKADLPNKEAWSGEDLDTAMGILYQARQQGKQTGDYSEFNRWRKLIQEKGTNAGQMIQAFAKYTRTPEGILMDAAETLERTQLDEAKRRAVMGDVEAQVSALETLEDGDLSGLIDLIERNSEIRGTTGLFAKKTGRQMDWALREVARSYADAEAFLRDVAVSQLRSIAADYLPVSPLEAVKNYRVMGMLSKASTVMRNLVSNNVFDPLESLSNDIVVPLDIALSKLTGQRTTAVDQSWFSKAKREGSLEGLLKSYIQVGLDANTENAKGRYEGTAGRTFKMTGNFLERLLSTWSKYEGYALNTTDEFQKGGIRAETQRGIDELKAAGKLELEALPDWSNETARQRTFQNEGAIAGAMTGLRAAANRIGVKDSRGGAFGVGDLMLPFARVPGNLVAQAANYSPLGLANGLRGVAQTIYQAKTDKVKNKRTLTPEAQAQAVRNVGRGITGTAALAGFGAMALAGLLNVAGAEDKDKEALERAQGKNGTQWNLSATLRWLNGEGTEWRDGDVLASIGFLEPLNAIMAAGALLADAYREDGALSVEDVVDSSASATFQSVLDLPAMSSIQSLIDAYTYSEGETTSEKVADAAISYAGSQASSFLLPNFVKGIATGLDDTARNPYSSNTTLGTARDSMVAGLPMFRETLPASVDGFGRERTNTGNTALNLLNSNLLPGQLQTYRQNAVEKELERLNDSTGAVNLYPGKNAPYTVRYDKQSYSLTPEERDAYQRSRGQATLELMESVIDSKGYQNASDQEKAEMLADAVSFGEDTAKRELMKARGVSYKSNLWEKAYAVTRQGIDFGIYLEYKDLLAEKKAAGKASAANAAVRKALFADRRLTQSQKEFLDRNLLSDGIYIPKDLNVDYSNAEAFAISQMSDGAQKRWAAVKSRFPDITPEQYAQAWSIYHKDSREMTAAEKKAALRELIGQQGNALYSLLGKD